MEMLVECLRGKLERARVIAEKGHRDKVKLLIKIREIAIEKAKLVDIVNELKSSVNYPNEEESLRKPTRS